MAYVVLILMVFFCAVAFIQQQNKEKVNAGSQDKMIKTLLGYYKTLREHQEETKANSFVIGYAQEEHRGKLQDNPQKMAVRINDEKGARRDGAAELGMEVIEIKGQFFYQFPVELESKLSSAELTAVLSRIKEKIESKYPDDFVGRAVSYITVVINGKKLLDMLDDGYHAPENH